MNDDKSFFSALVEADRTHEAAARIFSVSGGFFVHMERKKAVLKKEMFSI